MHWSVRHTQSFRCPLIYPIKWDNWLLHFFIAFSLLKKGKLLSYKLLAFRRKVKPFTHFTKNAKYNNNLWEECLSVSSKVHLAERKNLQVRYLTYGWFFYKVHLPHSKNDNKIGRKCKNAKFHRSTASGKTIRSITITFLVSTPNSK